ncbi:MAG: UvrD-helicase domain-containing protein, partial [bacterium]
LLNENEVRYNYFIKRGFCAGTSFSLGESMQFVSLYESITDKIDNMKKSIYKKEIYLKNCEIHANNSGNSNYLDNILSDLGNDVLDDDQRRVVLTNDSHLLVVAGAGSGKTTTMLAKIKYLVEKCNVKPEEILMISYTNAVVDELKEKLNKKMGIQCNISTFHMLGQDIIKKYTDDFTMVDDKKDFPLDILSLILERDYFCNKTKLNKFMDFFGDKLFMNKGETHNLFKKNCLEKNFITLINKNLIDECIEKSDYEKEIFSNMTRMEKCKKYLFLEKKDKIQLFYRNIIKVIYSKSLTSQIPLDSINSNKFNERDKMLLEIALKFSFEYNRQKTERGLIDVDDLIIKSNVLLLENPSVVKKNVKYKYIIIDEFQDISPIRFDLIKNLSTLLNAKVIAVGDDWQSIYGFSGSDISLFLNFNEYYNNSKVLKIENTYRNSQQLINVAGRFVQKNPHQISKNLKSNKIISNPIIAYNINNYDFDDEQEAVNDALEKCIIDIIKRRNLKSNDSIEIAILCKFRFEYNHFKDNELFIKKSNIVTYNKCPQIKIILHTVHSSKGLGFDEVILFNIKKDNYGFPSSIQNEKLIEYFSKEDEYYHAEERRLFYVACTRTRNRLYMLKPQYPSIFYEEIKNSILENPKYIAFDENSPGIKDNCNGYIPTTPLIENNESLTWINDNKIKPLTSNKNVSVEIESYLEDNNLKVDYKAIDDERNAIGLEGEEYVIKHEKTRLKEIGLDDYVDKILHVSKYNDNAGYDIKSFDIIDGIISEILIEVKSTREDCEKPIYITKNELEVSKKFNDIYRLYRVSNLNNIKPNIKKFSGPLDKLELTPDRYSARIK